MKKESLFLLAVILMASCNPIRRAFNPYGSWITAEDPNNQKTYQLKRAPDKDIRAKQFGVPNQNYSFFKRVKMPDSTIRYEKYEANSLPNSSIPTALVFETENRMLMALDGSEKMAFRISNKEEPTATILREAIARETRKRYPIKVRNWNSGRINGESHRFQNMDITFSSTGVLSISGNQTVNSCKGFTGRMIVRLLDIDGNVLFAYYFNSHGLGPKWRWLNPCSKNSRSYNYDIDLFRLVGSDPDAPTTDQVKQIVLGTYSFQILAERNSSSGRFEKFVERIKKVSDDLNDIGQNTAELYALINGIPIN